jgi:hypothetical protein
MFLSGYSERVDFPGVEAKRADCLASVAIEGDDGPGD